MTRIPRFPLAVILTFLLSLIFLYLTPGELLIIALAATPGGFIERKLLKALLTGFIGTILAALLAFLRLWISSPTNFTTALQAIPTFFAITLLLPAVMGILGGAIGAEVWQVSLKRVEPQVIKQPS